MGVSLGVLVDDLGLGDEGLKLTVAISLSPCNDWGVVGGMERGGGCRWAGVRWGCSGRDEGRLEERDYSHHRRSSRGDSSGD